MIKQLRIICKRIKQFFEDIFLQTIIAFCFLMAFMISFSVAQFLMTAHVHSGTVIAVGEWQKTLIKGTGKKSYDRNGWEREIIIKLDDNTQIVKAHTSDKQEENNFHDTVIGQKFDVVQSGCYSSFCPHNSLSQKSTNPDYWQRPFAYFLYLFDQNIAEVSLFLYWIFCGIVKSLLWSFHKEEKLTTFTFWTTQTLMITIVSCVFIFDSLFNPLSLGVFLGLLLMGVKWR